MLSRFAWYRQWRGGEWAQVNGLLWGKRWVRVAEDPADLADLAQVYYIHGLCAELGFSRTLSRQTVSAIVRRDVIYFARLTRAEASLVIRHLAALRKIEACPCHCQAKRKMSV